MQIEMWEESEWWMNSSLVKYMSHLKASKSLKKQEKLIFAENSLARANRQILQMLISPSIFNFRHLLIYNNNQN